MICNAQLTTERKVTAWPCDGVGRLIAMCGSFLHRDSSDHEIRLIASFTYGSSRFRMFSHELRFRRTVNVTAEYGKTTDSVCVEERLYQRWHK